VKRYFAGFCFASQTQDGIRAGLDVFLALSRNSGNETKEANGVQTKITGSEKAYLLGMRAAHLGVCRRGGKDCTVRVETGITHSSDETLFKKVFEKHEYGMRAGNEFIYAYLDNSFGFLLNPLDRIPQWVCDHDSYFLSFLTGFCDRHRTWFVMRHSDKIHFQCRWQVFSNKDEILRQVQEVLSTMGINARLRVHHKENHPLFSNKLTKAVLVLSICSKHGCAKLADMLLPYSKNDGSIHRMNLIKRVWRDIYWEEVEELVS